MSELVANGRVEIRGSSSDLDLLWEAIAGAIDASEDGYAPSVALSLRSDSDGSMLAVSGVSLEEVRGASAIDWTTFGSEDRFASQVCDAACRVLQIAKGATEGAFGGLSSYWAECAERAWAAAAVELAVRERKGRQ